MRRDNPGERNEPLMTSSTRTAPDTPAYEIPAHYLLCAVCVRGGCKTPQAPKQAMDKLLEHMWRFPYAPLRITADVDIIRAHYFDVQEGSPSLPRDFKRRQSQYVTRRKDLQVIRLLGINANTVLPAYLAYSILFERLSSLDGICKSSSKDAQAWPQCPHATEGYYGRIAAAPRRNLREQTQRGEELEGEGVWAMVRPRTKDEMRSVKKSSADFIMNHARQLYIRPSHLLCILCTSDTTQPLIQDNLIELRLRMEQDPGIPVTLTEGCCMVCDSCNIYHPGEHICYAAHMKNGLRDLLTLERLDLAPGTTLPAKETYARIYERIDHLEDVCGWGDGLSTTPFWAPCASYQTSEAHYQKLKQQRFIAGPAGS